MLCLILCYELNSVHANQRISKGDGYIYFVIIIISSVFVIILQPYCALAVFVVVVVVLVIFHFATSKFHRLLIHYAFKYRSCYPIGKLDRKAQWKHSQIFSMFHILRWHISAIHIILGQHNLPCQVKIVISSNQIISRQVKISYHFFCDSLSWLDEILSCILTKFGCFDHYCHLHFFFTK
jgi:hypothetical protein